ncbi:MAG TPA: MazG nucleotide pyrophosphohydrolase domain-containing protein [Tepidisphaeraceae bacterium]|nr:MazG nucleotide pyrophosphohydrolase domain-containing protein [Tepidisphaeraceae bacterium]
MDAQSMTLSAFQRHVSERWEAADRGRGSAATFVLFIEEVGELARALHKQDTANLREEFADCLAWLCTLANINGVDLAEAVVEKYLGPKRPEGSK